VHAELPGEQLRQGVEKVPAAHAGVSLRLPQTIALLVDPGGVLVSSLVGTFVGAGLARELFRR
jgi:hypothetical protein